jgi:predicted nucleic acid-binding protein
MLLIADTSVLINFLKVDRLNLIGRHQPKCVITQHVVDEVTKYYPEQQTRLNAAITDGHLTVISVETPAELQIFGNLQSTGRLGVGECSAIAIALFRDFAIAIDDRRAIKEARALAVNSGKNLAVFGTQDIIVRLIRAGHLTVVQADVLLVTWRTQHSFTLKIQSFAELLQ